MTIWRESVYFESSSPAQTDPGHPYASETKDSKAKQMKHSKQQSSKLNSLQTTKLNWKAYRLWRKDWTDTPSTTESTAWKPLSPIAPTFKTQLPQVPRLNVTGRAKRPWLCEFTGSHGYERTSRLNRSETGSLLKHPSDQTKSDTRRTGSVCWNWLASETWCY